ncbi:MAG: hypothetical protein V1914_00010 [archaeon]
MEMQTKQKHIKKQKFWKSKKFMPSLMGGFIIFIMVFSALGLWTGEDSQGAYEYKDIKFIQTEYGWVGYKDGQKITLTTNPAELENITINYIPIYTLNPLSKVYLSLDYTEKALRAVQNFEQNIKITATTRPACTTDGPRCANLPLKNCEDATDTTGVIVFKEDNQTKVTLINNCLTIQGEDPAKVVDKLILTQL